MSGSTKARRLSTLHSVGALSAATSVPASTIYDLVARGEIPAVRIGRAVRIEERDWLAFVESRREVKGVSIKPGKKEPSHARGLQSRVP